MMRQVDSFLKRVLVLSLLFTLSIYAEENAKILITIKVNGKPAEGIVHVFDTTEKGNKVAEGKAGKAIVVPPGEYNINVICTTLLDEPVHKMPTVTLKPGEEYQKVVKFPAGTIILQTYMGKRPLKNKPLKIKKEGSEQYFKQKGKTWHEIMLSPGTYEAEVKISRKRTFIIKGIQVYEGAKRTLPTNVQL